MHITFVLHCYETLQSVAKIHHFKKIPFQVQICNCNARFNFRSIIRYQAKLLNCIIWLINNILFWYKLKIYPIIITLDVSLYSIMRMICTLPSQLQIILI